MRIITGAISHETSTFTTVPTTWESYRERFGYLHGAEILERFRQTNTPVGGFIEGADAHGFELIPTIFAEPHPSGPTPRAIFDTILNELLQGIEAAGPIDGVLLELHGSMVAEGIDDGEGHILTAVRELIGPEVPIVGQLDIHSNVSKRMVEMADVLIGPKTDTYCRVCSPHWGTLRPSVNGTSGPTSPGPCRMKYSPNKARPKASTPSHTPCSTLWASAPCSAIIRTYACNPAHWSQLLAMAASICLTSSSSCCIIIPGLLRHLSSWIMSSLSKIRYRL
jgi:hypothetical protein